MSLEEIPLLFLDMQTTGATPASGNILELAWCIGRAGCERPAEEHSFLLKQPDGAAVPRRIQALTGITDEDMTQSVEIESVKQTLMEHLDRSSFKRHLVIHYARFERPFLQEHFPETLSDGTIVCTHQIAARMFPNLPSRSIRGVAGYFGYHMDEHKRAGSHALATFIIWRHLCRELAQQGISTIDSLIAWLAAEPPGKRARYEYPLPREKRLGLPDQPGIYRMMSKTDDVLYVGKATSLKSRVNSYFRGRRHKDVRKLEMLAQTWDIRHTACETVLEACLLEVAEIKRLAPPYNISMKCANRPLAFYSEDFSSASPSQSAEHPLGPFRSELIMDGFTRLVHSLRQNEFDPHIFFDEMEPDALSEGFRQMLQRYALASHDVASARSLLALGLVLLRKRLKEEDSADELTEEPESEDEAISPDDQEDHVLTPDEIADKFERLLIHAARAYRLSRRLTSLMNSTVVYQESDTTHSIIVTGGALTFGAKAMQALGVPAVNEQTQHYESMRKNEIGSRYPWLGLGLDTFDRLRVLNTELQRLIVAGQTVQIQAV